MEKEVKDPKSYAEDIIGRFDENTCHTLSVIEAAHDSIIREIGEARDAVIRKGDNNTKKVIGAVNAQRKLSTWAWIVPILIMIATAIMLFHTSESNTLESILIAIATGGMAFGIFVIIDSATGGGKDEENEAD